MDMNSIKTTDIDSPELDDKLKGWFNAGEAPNSEFTDQYQRNKYVAYGIETIVKNSSKAGVTVELLIGFAFATIRCHVNQT